MNNSYLCDYLSDKQITHYTITLINSYLISYLTNKYHNSHQHLYDFLPDKQIKHYTITPINPLTLVVLLIPKTAYYRENEHVTSRRLCKTSPSLLTVNVSMIYISKL